MKNIQEEIERIALHKLNEDIRKQSVLFKKSLGSLVPGIYIKIIGDDEKMSCPYLTQLFESEIVINKLIERNLPSYIEVEINKLLYGKRTSDEE